MFQQVNQVEPLNRFMHIFIVVLVFLKVGYIVMVDPSTGVRTNLLRMKGAGVVGIYHPLIDERTMRILHGYESTFRNIFVFIRVWNSSSISKHVHFALVLRL